MPFIHGHYSYGNLVYSFLLLGGFSGAKIFVHCTRPQSKLIVKFVANFSEQFKHENIN